MKYFGLFSKIRTKDDAKYVIKTSSNTFYIFAVIQGLVGLFLAPALLLDALAIAILSYFLNKYKSMTAAYLLLALSCFALYQTTMNRMDIINGSHEIANGGGNIILAIILFGISLQAVRATHKYKKKK
jgi:hypothetical protein